MLEFIKTILNGIKAFVSGETSKLNRLATNAKTAANNAQIAADKASSAADEAKEKALAAQSSAETAQTSASLASGYAHQITPKIFTNVYDASNPLIDWDADTTDMVSTNTVEFSDYNHTYYKIPNVNSENIQKVYDRFKDVYRSIMSYGSESNLTGEGNISHSGNCKWTTYVMVATEAGAYSLTYGNHAFTIEVPEPGVYVCIRQNDTYTFHTKKVVVPTYKLEVQALFQSTGQYRTLRFYDV